MENKRKNVYITIFVITTIVAACVAVYFTVTSQQNVKELQARVDELSVDKENNTLDKVSEVEETISTNDLFALDTQEMLLAKIVDGDLFYWLGNGLNDNAFFTTTSSESSYTKVDSNVRRIKTFMLGSDTSISFLTIKEDGSVYVMKVAYDAEMKNRRVTYNEYEPFSGMKIDDIISIRGYSGVQSGVNATVKLLDGTQTTINKIY